MRIIYNSEMILRKERVQSERFSFKANFFNLFFLGLIHANHGGEITDYLLNQLKDASTDVSFLEIVLLETSI